MPPRHPREETPRSGDHSGPGIDTPGPPNVEVRPIGGIFGTAGEDDTAPGVGEPRRPAVAKEPSLLANPDFRLLWTSRLLSQTAQGALLYALLILVVDLSDAAIFTSLFVLCSNIPSIAFGLPGGIVADNVSRKFLLVTMNAFRFMFMIFLVASEPGLAAVFAATLGIWTIHQFYSPAEASALAEIVPSHRYTGAQAMFNLALTISQGVGLVVVAPLLLLIDGPRLVFVFAGVLWLIAGALTTLLPALNAQADKLRREPRRSLMESLGNGWRFVRGDRSTFEAIVSDVLVSVGMSALIVIIPFYLVNVLGTSQENTVFVFAPAALGLVVGLRAAPILARIIGDQMNALMGLVIFAVVVIGLGFVEQTYDVLTNTFRLPLQQITDALSIPSLTLVAMVLSIPAGFASSIVNVSARAILLRRSPANVRGQVIATQGLIGNLVGFIPTLLAGLAADLFGVQAVAVGIGVLIIVLAFTARFIGRRSSSPPVAHAPLT